MSSFSFLAEIREDRILRLLEGSPTGRVSVAITPAENAIPSGGRLLTRLRELQAALPAGQGWSQEPLDNQLENERSHSL